MQVELGPLEETLLIPLFARAREASKPGGLLHDPRTVRIVASLDYDFARWKQGRTLAGTVLRARMLDRYVEQFLQEHPDGTVIEIGCGLDTRFDRLDNGRVRWFDLDLPDVIALRRRFFAAEARRSMIAASVLDFDWMAQVAATGGPWMFVAEAVFIYLDAPDARRAICALAHQFPGARIAFDTAASAMVEQQAAHDARRRLSEESWFRWRCDDPRQIEAWGSNLRLVASKTFLDADADLMARVPLPLRLAARFAPSLVRRQADQYRLNLVQVEPPAAVDTVSSALAFARAGRSCLNGHGQAAVA